MDLDGVNEMVERTVCDLCESRQHIPISTGLFDRRFPSPDEFSIVQCSGCGLMSLNPRPTPALMSTFYPADYTRHTGSVYLEDKPLLLGRLYMLTLRLFGHDPFAFSRYPRGRLLDVGCGKGALLHQFQNLGWKELIGVDTSLDAVAAADRPPLKILCSSVEDAAFPDGYFDYIVLKHVLEHLSSPSKTLGEIMRILVPGGILFVEVPNNSSIDSRLFGKFWAHLDVPRHQYFFTSDSVSKLLKIRGFEIVKMYTYPNPADIPNTLSYLGRQRLDFLKHGILPWMIMAAAFPVSAASALFNCSSHLVVYARKPGWPIEMHRPLGHPSS